MTEGEPTASSPQDVAASFPTAADDSRQLTQEIHETREQLGETVEALAGKADATALAEDKTSQLSGRLRSGAVRRASRLPRRLGCCAASSQAACPGRCRTPSRRPGRPGTRSGR
jgi:cell division septum initiation protein DivIVA